ncbi:hypothetical protein [Winogradskyella sp. 3972H.M.0a.05]|uniref:hypothetical protein n=1 Tax=Winogradskyella sp. 3972H.M.0a.05 TaxID=2950277 RepID=UPI0033911688
MDLSRLLNIVLIVIGGLVALYAQAEAKQSPYILIIGIVFLMIGLYRISRNIPSKQNDSEPPADEQ